MAQTEGFAAVCEKLRRGEAGPGDAECDALAALLVYAVAFSDLKGLVTALDEIQFTLNVRAGNRVLRGRLLSLSDVARWGQQKALPSAIASAFDPQGLSHRFLELAHLKPGLSNVDLQERLGTSAAVVGRVGRNLLEGGLVVRHRFGRCNQWEVTPRGRKVLNELAQHEAWDLTQRVQKKRTESEAGNEIRQVDIRFRGGAEIENIESKDRFRSKQSLARNVRGNPPKVQALQNWREC
ncbi:hypothetical protein [Streptomyces bugieae]|uniref:HTH marR-type domain-containing protein n=1 Tax=Streptomyces bugieae TaxID=3098223 RepID=A0ABU7NR86_9ACTN|nr:hypothetical protein [Streptomyces sp. DSM 41528]